MKGARIAAITLFLVLTAPLSAQWARAYGTPINEFFVSVSRAADGGYFLVSGDGAVSTRANLFVFKLAEDGRIIWQKSYPLGFLPSGKPLLPTPDGGFLQAGVSSRLTVIKVRADGTTEWQNTYAGKWTGQGSPILEYGLRDFRPIATREGGYLIAGCDRYWHSGGSTAAVPILLKIAASGALEWVREYPVLNYKLEAVVQTGDGGYLWTGNQVSFYYPSVMALIKTDSEGSVQWIKDYGAGCTIDLVRLSGGDLLALMLPQGPPIIGALIRLNDAGEILSGKTYPTGVASTRGIVPTPDGGFFLTEYQSGRFLASKFDAQQAVEWSKSFSEGQKILAGKDAACLIGWTDARPGALDMDVMLAKVGPDGVSGLSCFGDENAPIALSDLPALSPIEGSLTSQADQVYATPAEFSVQNGEANASFLCDDAPVPILSVSPRKLTFGAMQGGPAVAARNILIENGGGGSLDWTAQPSAGWIVCQPLAGTGNRNASISVDISGLSPGDYQGSVRITVVGAENSPVDVSVKLTVYASGGTAGPFGFFETPQNNLTVSSSVAVTGWALDDLGVATVKIYRDPVAGEQGGPNGLVYIGDGVFVPGARPDVEAAYPKYPYADRAGWGYMMLTNFLPNGGNGTFSLHAIASDLEGNSTLLGTITIKCDNAHEIYPFGAIDTPAQGGTVSGNAYVNYGWALAVPGKSIAADGSTISVWVDGLPLGHPSYGHYRVDIATLFPGYANANGAIGFLRIDTTGYANGLHTIAWSVTDTEGVTGGIGSRHFNALEEGAGASGPFSLTRTISPSAPLYESLSSDRDERAVLQVALLPPHPGAPVPSVPPIAERWAPPPLRGASGRLPSPPEILPQFGERHYEGGGQLDGRQYPPLDKRGVGGDFLVTSRGADEALREQMSFSRAPVCVRRGFDLAAPYEESCPGVDGVIEVLIREVERVEIRLSSPKGETIFAAHHLVGGEVRPLPVGSTFDPATGAFTWQPGPGFIGPYDFVFHVRAERQAVRKIPLRIAVRPRSASSFSSR